MSRGSPIEVRFRGALPDDLGATSTYDAATRLGRAVQTHFEGQACTIVVNANRQRVLWLRTRDGRVEMSVHWALLAHTSDVLAWLRKEVDAVHRLRSHLPSAETPSAPMTRTSSVARAQRPARIARGEVHDLQPMLDAERVRWPPCPDEVFVEWGEWPKVPPRRTLRLGSCLPPRIRIHPVLDHDSVPDWFVHFVVFHEVLHVRFPPERGPTGRRRVHTRTFRTFERRHPDYARAEAFERAHIGEWLARCRARLQAVR